MNSKNCFIKSICVLHLLIVSVPGQFIKYHNYNNLTLSSQYKTDGLKLKSTFIVSKSNPASFCMIECNVNKDCLAATLADPD